MNRRIPLAPVEGWTTVVLTVLLCLTFAWSLDDARWVLGRPEYLDFLQWMALGGVLVGFVGPKVGWGRWQTYVIGSVFAALVVPLIVGSIGLRDGGSLHQLYVATATAVVNAYSDIVVHNQASTIQYLHYLLSLGLLVWATSMFASYADLRPSPPAQCRRRGGPAAGREHGPDPERPAPLPGGLQPGGPLPADPRPRHRGAVGVASPADR